MIFSNNKVFSFWKAAQYSRWLTFADRSVARVTRLAGAAVAPDHVEAQGVIVAVVLPAEALVVLWGEKTKWINKKNTWQMPPWVTELAVKKRFNSIQQRQMFVLRLNVKNLDL